MPKQPEYFDQKNQKQRTGALDGGPFLFRNKCIKNYTIFAPMEDLRETTEKRIQALGLKKGHVAKQIDCTQMELTHFLKGRRKLRPESETKLRSYLGI